VRLRRAERREARRGRPRSSSRGIAFLTRRSRRRSRRHGYAAASELRYSDEHYPHDCIDVDLNCVFPIDRLRELASEGVIGGTTASHFSMGFTQQLAEIRRTTIPTLARAVDKVRPDAVILTGG